MGDANDIRWDDEEDDDITIFLAAGRADKRASGLLPLRRPAFTKTRWWMVALFTITTSLLFADQNVLAPNLTRAARDFGFNDEERDVYMGGIVSGIFFTVGAPAAILVGYLADKYDRRLLLWLCVLIGEAPCMLTVFVTQYWQFLLTRVLTGLALGGAGPLIYGLISDLYPVTQRATVTSLIVISTGAGVSIGQGIAGIEALGWRLPFLLVSFPAIVVASLMLITTDDPKRGGQEAALQAAYTEESFVYSEKFTWPKFRRLLGTPTNALIILQDKGLSHVFATMLVLLYGLGGLPGTLLGGYIGQRLYNSQRGLISVFSGLMVWLGMPALFWLINGDIKGTNIALLASVTFVGGAAASVAGVNIRPLIMNVNEPEMRGMALSLQATLDDVGKGAGPFLVSQLIAWMGRETAFNLSVCGWLPCGLMIMLSGLYLARDEDAMQRRLETSVEMVRYQGVASNVDLEGLDEG